MKKHFDFNITYCVDGQSYTVDRLKCDHFELVITEKEEVMKVVLYPKCEISNINISMSCTHLYTPESKIFVNGYQSWTESREFAIDEKLQRSGILGKLIPNISAYGDERFVKRPPRGVFHGYTYGYIRDYTKTHLYGSMTEINGYTIIQFNTKHNAVIISKDLEGVKISKPYEVFNIGYFEGEYDEVFDRYFSLQNLPGLRLKSATGYTSWYNYYKKVTRKNIDNDLLSFQMQGVQPMIFQIDDGYQKHVGDWLDVKKAFGDMKELTDSIHDAGIKAGLWLAPFACFSNSKLYKEHKDWLLRDEKGRLVKGGFSWYPISTYYVLDFLNPGVQKYLKDVFFHILNVWNFDMVKLDFLYAECLVPRQNKSRGQIMCEAMDFLRECVGNKLILGCGVPLGAAFGRVDFCRIGCDVALKWEEGFIGRIVCSELPSTIRTLNNTIFRRHLNGRAFVNDPDVFFLRDYNIKLTEEQRLIIADVNKLFGGVLFVSDDVARYSERSLDNLKSVFKDDEIEILEAEYMTKSIISIRYTINGIEQELVFDIQQGKVIRG